MAQKLNVLLYSYVFYPSVGGIESISLSFAEGLTHQGHQCNVVTESESDQIDAFECPIFRKPDLKTKIKLVKSADIIIYNGVGLGLQPWPLVYRKPFIWIHQGYQISCIDGLGWFEGESAPMTPWRSIVYHFRKRGFIFASKGALIVFTKFFFAKYLVTRNVACTDWVLKRLPLLKHKLRIYSPYPLKKFEKPTENLSIIYDFVFVGRLVSEKGLLTLVSAFNKLIKEFNSDFKLLIIGDGNWKTKIQQVISKNDLNANVTMAGKKIGEELTNLIHSCRIAVVPSEWEEPMGGVALELLSAGRNIIVSANGGMAECVGRAGLTFKNGDADDLADVMRKLWSDTDLQVYQKVEAKKQLEKFQIEQRITEHVKLFDGILKK